LIIIPIVVAMIKTRKTIFFLLVIMGIGSVSRAQQDPQFSLYMLNELYNNPAYAGVEGVSKLQLIHRSQWLGYNPSFSSDDGGAPTTQVFSFNTPILKFRSGAGLHVVNDNIGPQNNLQILGSYAYHLELQGGKLSFGIRAGVYSQSINFNKYRPVDINDPLIKEGKETQFRPDMGIGVYYKKEKYYAGVSLNHILKSSFNFGISTDSLKNALENHLVVTGGYIYDLNYDIKLEPSVIVKSDFNTYSFDVTVVGTYREKFSAGLSYRQSEAMVALFGVSLLKDNALYLGYAMDYVIQAQEAKQKTSHELLLSYTLPALSGGGKKVVRTPRFRH
jgi:type IX secretion system PorP/SprF family membrane protein